jgi:hypothetical protein
MKQPMTVLTSQGTNEWYTPPHIIERARLTLGGIDLDPASNATAQTWIQAGTYYDGDHIISGLGRPWFGRMWLNPPFDDTPRWVKRMERVAVFGEIEAGLLLVNSAPGYAWWEELWRLRPVVMLRERVRFIREDGTPGGQAKKGQTIAYFGHNNRRFIDTWHDLGRIVLP